jgi:putative DNA primase/helicase
MASTPRPSFDLAQIADFLRLVLDPSLGCLELRLFGAWRSHASNFIEPAPRQTITLSGWYDRIDAVIADVQGVKGVSVYATLNPVHPDLIYRARNRLVQTKRDHSTSDSNILCHRWMYIDCDSVRPDGISATQEERDAALALRDRILVAYPFLRDSAIWGGSGNGGWILVRLPDLLNNEESYKHHRGTYELLGRVLSGLAEQFGKKGRAGDLAFVDEVTKNASRVMCLPGTLKCKGEDDPRRPWRLVTIEGTSGAEAESLGRPQDWRPVEVDAEAWARMLPEPANKPAAVFLAPEAANGWHGQAAAPQQTAPRPGGKPTPPAEGVYDRAWAEYRCRKMIFDPRFGQSIAGMKGHDALFHAAAMIWSDFGLTDEVGFGLFEEWNRTMASPPESDAQVRHKWESVAKAKGSPTLGEYWKARKNEGGRNGPRSGPLVDPDEVLPFGLDINPHRLARMIISQRHTHTDGMAIRFWREEFHAWNGSYYRRLPRKEVTAEVTGLLESESQRLYQLALIRYGIKQDRKNYQDKPQTSGGKGEPAKDKPPVPFRVTRTLVSDVIQAMTDIALLTEEDCSYQPAWLVKGQEWPAEEILPARNALIHLPTFAEGDGDEGIRRPTPLFFSPFAVGYDLNREATAPINWLKFLGALPLELEDEIQYQIWPKDTESIATLQEWMGYLLTPDTSQQKIMMVIGPRRSGKGTIIRIIRALIGFENVVNPTLSQLGTNFGMAPLIGKQAAIITDARISGRTDTAVIVEQLLAVSGEDARSIDRKHRESIDTKLTTRFMLVSNELPRMRDTSGALAGRMIFLQLTESFYGREDPFLIDKLLPELPGILLWAIEGWARLKERCHFSQPAASRDLERAMEDLASPVKAFLKECCKVGEGDEFMVPCFDLFNRWRWWAESKGQDWVGTEEEFGRNLRAALSHTKRQRPKVDGKRVWVYSGVRLLKDGEDIEDDDEVVDLTKTVPF